MDRLQIYTLLGILLLFEFCTAATITNVKPSSDLNGATTTPTPWATNRRDEMDFGNPFESPSEMARAQETVDTELRKESSQSINDLDPDILVELERTNEPIQRTFVDKNGFNHNTIYKRNPLDGSINKLQTGSISLDELQKQGNFIPGVGAVPVEELLRTNGPVNKNIVDGDVQQRAVYRLLVPRGGATVTETEPNEVKSGDNRQINPTTTTKTTPATTPTKTLTATPATTPTKTPLRAPTRTPTKTLATTPTITPTRSIFGEPAEHNNVNMNNRGVVLPNFNGLFENPATKTDATDNAPVSRRWYTDSDHFFNSAFSDFGGSLGYARPSTNLFNIQKSSLDDSASLLGNGKSDATPTISVIGNFEPIQETYFSPDGKVRITTWRWQRRPSVDGFHNDRSLKTSNDNLLDTRNTRFDRMPSTYNRRY